jgi:hypothetical protein
MKVIYTLIGGIIISLIVLIVAYIIGTSIAVLSSPIFLYFGLKPLKATLCANGVMLFWLLRALSK